MRIVSRWPLCLAIALLGPVSALASGNFPTALTGKTLRPGDTGNGCTGCHAAAPTSNVSSFFARLTGPASLAPGTGGTYAVEVYSQDPSAGGSSLVDGLHLGAAIAAGDPGTVLAPISAPLTAVTRADLVTELIHASSSGALAVTSSGTASYSFTYTMPAGATPGSTHTLYAVSRVGVGQSNGAWAHAAPINVLTAPPAPGALSVTGVTGTTVSLSWSGSGPAYRIVYKTGSAAPANENDGTAVEVGTATTYTATGLLSNATYSFRVLSHSTSGTLVYSLGGSASRVTAAGITSSLAPVNGTVNIPITSYTLTAPGATSFGATNLPPGLTLNSATHVISGTPTTGGSYTVTLSASNANGTDTRQKSYLIGAGAQTITFAPPPSVTYSLDGSFPVSAASSSGLPLTYTTNTGSVCFMASPNAGTVLMLTAGTCIVRADQAGNVSYLATSQTLSVTITPTLPGAPTAGAPTPGNGSLSIPVLKPANTGGLPITGYSASCSPAGAASAGPSPIVVSGLANGTAYTCTVQAINAVGASAPSASVVGTPRPDPDGQLDPHFGTGGVSPFAFVGATAQTALGMAVSSTGGIALVGAVGNPPDFAVVRYTASGALDTAFGEVTTDFGGGADFAYGAAWYSDGRVIVVGSTNKGSSTSIAMARYTNTGALDPTFGTGGKATLLVEKNSSDTAYAVVLDRSSRIHIAGQSTGAAGARFFVAKIAEDGTLDSTFGVGGVRIVPTLAAGGAATRLMIDSARRFVAAGITNNGTYSVPVVARLTTTGVLDTTFGGTGVVTRDFGLDAPIFALALSAGDGPVIAGPAFTIPAVSGDFMWTAFKSDGTPGALNTADVAGGSADQARGILRQADGKTVVAGNYNTGTGTEALALVRFMSNGSVDPTFGAAGRTLTSIGTTDSLGFGALLAQRAGTVVAGGTSDNRFVVARYLLDAPGPIGFDPPMAPIGTNTWLTSNAVPIANTTLPVYVEVTSGLYSINCAPDAFTSAPGAISPGQTVCVRHLTGGNVGDSVTTTLVVGGQAATFASTATVDISSLPPEGDFDADGIPNGVEGPESRNPLVKDNDIFASSRLFAMQQYRDFLGREGDPGGIDFYTQNLDNAASTRTQVIESFLASPEFQNGLPQCTRLYFSFFLRIPDYNGLLFQVNAFRAGTPLEAIAQNFYNSPEFTSRYGALSNDDYINLVYQNVLGRAPDPGGFAYYKNLLDTNAITKGQMMIGFSESPEFQQIIGDDVYVTAVYVGMLRRAPDQGGLDFYVNLIEGGAPRNSIITNFFNSPEYHNRFLP